MKFASQEEEAEYANTVIAPSVDETDCGIIDGASAKAAGIPAGPIKLYYGYPGKNGWGLRHIEGTPGRVKDICRDYASPMAFACEVGKNWDAIHKGPAGPQPRITISMEKNGERHGIPLQWNGRAWSIVTMLPFRQVNYEIIYKKLAT